jgi:hypothetical protein
MPLIVYAPLGLRESDRSAVTVRVHRRHRLSHDCAALALGRQEAKVPELQGGTLAPGKRDA